MSQCPYGLQVEDAIKPVLDKLGDAVDFSVDFIATDMGDGTFKALHGQPEVEGNIIQLCTLKYYPNTYMDLIVCMNKDAKSIPGNWVACANKLGMDEAKLKTCYDGDEGKQLLSVSASKAMGRNARGSPTIYLNNEQYRGGRKSADFLRAICNVLETKPQACKDIPAPAAIEMVTISDKRCNDCDESVDMIKGQLKGMFPGLVVKSLDYSSKNGKKLFDDLGLKFLPSILFNDSIKQGESYNAVSRYLSKKGDYQELAIGATFDPTKEICDNKKDDTGNGLVDCDDPDCDQAMACREEKKKDLQVFVMSQCPYGTRALDAMKEVLENFGDDINFNINFIASYDENTDKFSALHGQPEVDENIRELCAIKHYPDNYKYMDYIWCRNKDIQSADWEPCAEEAGMDVETIKTCFEDGEGKELHKENIKIGEALGIGASPTWLANNKKTFSGIDAETVKQNYCSVNSDLAGCENTLTGNTATAGGTAPSGGACG